MEYKGKVSSFRFHLVGLKYRSEEEISNIPNMKIGKFCILRRDLHNPYDEYATFVYHNGYQMGYVESRNSKRVSECMQMNKLLLCQIVDIEELEGKHPIIILELYYKDENGTATLPDSSGEQSWNIVDPSDFTGEVDENYFLVDETFEVVNRKLSYYGVNELPKNDTYLLLQINEDDHFMIQFIHDFNMGFIRDKDDLKQYIKDFTEFREFGDNKALRKRINDYLEFIGMELE